MKKLTIAAVLAAQMLTAAQPALAADLTDTRAQRTGAFAGFRLRLPLDGEAGRQPIRAGLTLAPTFQTESRSGEVCAGSSSAGAVGRRTSSANSKARG